MLGAEELNERIFANKEEKEIAQAIATLLTDGSGAFIGVSSVYEDLLLCRKIAGRYPWMKNEISRKDHLHFAWMAFVNCCYLLEERVKNFGEVCNSIYRAFGKSDEFDVSKAVRDVSKALEKAIRARGQHTHQGHPGHKKIIEYGLFELMERSGKWPKGWPRHAVFHTIAKSQICQEMEEEIAKVEPVLVKILGVHGAKLAGHMRTFNTAYDALTEKAGVTGKG